MESICDASGLIEDADDLVIHSVRTGDGVDDMLSGGLLDDDGNLDDDVIPLPPLGSGSGHDDGTGVDQVLENHIMNDELNKLNFNEGENKLISNVTANEISNTTELKELLVKQIENRVRWRESVINMINGNVNHFIEIGPGKVLSGLVKRINKEVKIDTINNQGDIEGLKI